MNLINRSNPRFKNSLLLALVLGSLTIGVSGLSDRVPIEHLEESHAHLGNVNQSSLKSSPKQGDCLFLQSLKCLLISGLFGSLALLITLHHVSRCLLIVALLLHLG